MAPKGRDLNISTTKNSDNGIFPSINQGDERKSTQKRSDAQIPNPEVSEERVSRRRLTAAYKLRILEQADACKDSKDGIGSLLRREGLYASMLAQWRRARDAGVLAGLSEKKRGVKPKEINPLSSHIKELEHSKRELEKRLELSQKIIEAQKKIAEIFTALNPPHSNGMKS